MICIVRYLLFKKHSVHIPASSVFVVQNSDNTVLSTYYTYYIYTVACPLYYENNIDKEIRIYRT